MCSAEKEKKLRSWCRSNTAESMLPTLTVSIMQHTCLHKLTLTFEGLTEMEEDMWGRKG